MIANDLAQLALRTRALSLTVCTTGSVSLAATATGFSRSDGGSFVTDGFAVGMCVVSSGFSNGANNVNSVVTAVTATALTVTPYVVAVSGGVQSVTHPATVVEANAAGRTIAAKLPSMRAWENTAPVGLTTFQPVPGIPYVAEEYTPATSQMLSAPYAGGLSEETGLYAIQWYGLSGSGITALRKSVDALKALFTPGTSLTAGGNTVQMRGQTGAVAGQIIDQGNGFTVLELKVYWLARTTNAVAA